MKETIVLVIQRAIEDGVKKLRSANFDLTYKLKESDKAQSEVCYREKQLVEMADFLDEYSSSTLRKDENWLNSVLDGDDAKTTELRARYDALMKDDRPD